MSESFGTRLRLQREQQRLTLASVAARTKIKMTLLEALERDDLSSWPTGIFRRAHLRTYAHALGLDPDAVVRECLELNPDPVETIETIAQRVAASGQPPTRLRCLVDSAMTVLPGLLHRTPGPDIGLGKIVTAAPPAPFASPAVVERTESEPNLPTIARLCSRFGQAANRRELASLLDEAASLLGAVGLIVWSWDRHVAALRPLIAHGYSDAMLAQFPPVRRDADNAISAAFRSVQKCIVERGDQLTGAVVVPLATAGECVGVLALELRDDSEQRESVSALATILALPLAALIRSEPMAVAVNA